MSTDAAPTREVVHRVGDTVEDRNDGTWVFVTRILDDTRADEYVCHREKGIALAEADSNSEYADDVPVVIAALLSDVADSVIRTLEGANEETRRQVAHLLTDDDSVREYPFPADRLRNLHGREGSDR